MGSRIRRFVVLTFAGAVGLGLGVTLDHAVLTAQARRPAMKRFYTGTDGLSHVEEIALNRDSVMEKVKSVSINVTPPGTFQEWHPGPERRYIISLTDGGQLEVAEGKVDLPRGSIYFIDDVTGRGHRTANVSTEERVSIVLSFENQTQIVGPLQR